MKKILLIEDNPEHLTDAKKLLEERVNIGVIGSVTYADTLSRAMAILRTENYDGLVSDVFFPRETGMPEEQHGTEVADHALSLGMPIVLTTSTFHHGRRTQPVFDWANERGVILIDSGNPNSRDGEAQSKNWNDAYLALAYLIEGKESGKIQITPRGMDSLAGAGANFANQANYWHKEGKFKEKIEALVPEVRAIMKRTIEKYCQGMFK